MKKFLLTIMAIMVVCSMVGCGSSSDKPVVKDEVSDNAESNTEKNNPEVDVDNDDAEETDKEDTEDLDEEVYSNKVYSVGKDIPAGTYVVNCSKSDYGMDVVVFATEKEYGNFQNAEQFTVGEYRAAIETHAWTNLYIEEGENAYISLKEGNIILLDGGMCDFSKYDAHSSNVLYSGIYVIGEDLDATNMDIKCLESYLKVTVFESKEKYAEYHKASRFTVGEESDAIEKYSSSTDYIYKDDMTSVNLEDGMVLMIDDGSGEYSVDDGPVIN